VTGRRWPELPPLSNGNFIVTDPGFDASGPSVLNVGAVYLYRPDVVLMALAPWA